MEGWYKEQYAHSRKGRMNLADTTQLCIDRVSTAEDANEAWTWATTAQILTDISMMGLTQYDNN